VPGFCAYMAWILRIVRARDCAAAQVVAQEAGGESRLGRNSSQMLYWETDEKPLKSRERPVAAAHWPRARCGWTGRRRCARRRRRRCIRADVASYRAVAHRVMRCWARPGRRRTRACCSLVKSLQGPLQGAATTIRPRGALAWGSVEGAHDRSSSLARRAFPCQSGGSKKAFDQA